MKFYLQRQKVGKKVKQVPVVLYFSDDIAEKEEEKSVRQENSKFAVYKEDSEEFHHVIKILKEKKSVKTKLQNKGYEVQYIFSKSEIDKVKSGEFVLNDVPLEVVTYLEQHLGEWDKYLEEIQVPKKKKRKNR